MSLMTKIMLACGVGKSRIFRNNQGLASYPDGSKVRYGIANPGGADCLGWVSIIVTPEMVGNKVAIFTAVEVKEGSGRANRDQKTFIKAVLDAGGRGGVARSVEEALKIVGLA
jgi:hypothetical protein